MGYTDAIGRVPFFVRKFYRDLTNPLRYPANIDDVKQCQLGHYYLVYDEDRLRQGGSHDFHFDDQGIPVLPTYIDVHPRRMHYYPIAIGQFALAIFHTYLRTSRTDDLTRFLKLADWLVERQAADGCWHNDNDIPVFGVYAPWVSAMGQGRVMSVLARAWQHTGDDRYIESARKGLPPFRLPISEGGVADSYGGVETFEEYPGRPAPHVLNGMIFALFGLWDMVRALPDEDEPRLLFDQGVSGIETLLPLYDTGWWTLYDLYHLEQKTPRNPATSHYHDIHTKQMQVLYAITGRPPFAEYAGRWAEYEIGWHRRLRAYANKTTFIVRRKLA
ncbi:MAG: D-glucuronyl C5-epimerase family protein [Geminicoccaceae bacterium]